jgi:hypothetical protein
MSDETLRWKLFPFSLTREAKHWCKRHVKSSQGDWEALRSSFCSRFFSINRVVKLHAEIINFKKEKNDSIGKTRERFENILDSGPNLSLLEHVLLQHFFTGLNKKTRKHLNTAVGGLFMHITAKQAKDILTKIVNDFPQERERLLEEESQIAE